MKRILPAALLAACGTAAFAQPYNPASPNVRISQVYAFGGNTGTNPVPTYRNDFIELFNPTQRSIDLSGWGLYSTSATSTATWSRTSFPTGLTIGPGQYVLVSLPGGSNAASPLLSAFDASSQFGLGTTGSKIALTCSLDPVLAGANPQNAFIVDLLGTNATATGFEGAPFPSPGSLVLAVRRIDSCVDTNNNAADFSAVTPAPRTLLTPATPCAVSALDLTVVATGPTAPITQFGQFANFTIGVDNLGTNLAGTAGATLTVVFPPTLDFDFSSIGGTYNAATRTLTAPLPVIEGAPFRLPVSISGITVANGSAPLQVSVSTTDAETSLTNNSTTAALVVSELAALSLTMTSSQADCSAPVPVGSNLSYTVAVTNDGPATASAPVTTITLPLGTTYLPSSSATAGTLVHNNGVVTWTAPNQTAGTTRNATINVTVNTDGVLRAAATVATGSFDSDLTNNTARAINLAPKADVGFPLVVTSVAGHPTNVVPGTFGSSFTGGDAFRRMFPSPDGNRFIMRVTASGGNGDILMAGTANPAAPNLTYLGRQTTSPVADAGIAGLFDNYVAINDSGDFVFSTNTDAATATDEVVARGNVSLPETFTLVAREGNAVPPFAPAAVTFGSTNTIAGITNGGEVALVTTLAGEGIISTGTASLQNNSALIRGAGNSTLVLQKGVTVPGGQLAGPGNATWSFIEGGGAEWRVSNISADGSDTFITGSINTGDTSNNEVLVYNNNVVLQEGVAIPGSSVTDPVFSFAFSHMDADGTWSAYGRMGTSAAPGFGYAVRNGQLLARHGDPILPGSTETYSGNTINPAFTQTFFMLTGRGSDYVLGGVTSNADTYKNGVLVHNGTTLLAREGDPVDLDGNGIADDDAYIATFRDDRAFISADRKLWVAVDLRTRAATCTAAANATPGTPTVIGTAILVINLPPAATFCTADVAGGGDQGNLPDGNVDGSDFIAFINSFGIGDATIDPAADVAGGGDNGDQPDGTIDGSDFIAFINAFAAGC